MRYGENRAVLEISSNGSLDQFIRHVIDVGRGFVNDENLTLLHQCSGQTDQLFLPNTQIRAVFRDIRFEPVGHFVCHDRFQLDVLERIPNLLVGIFVELIEIVANRAGEEHGILRNDRNARPEIFQPDRGDVDVIDADLSFDDVSHPE